MRFTYTPSENGVRQSLQNFRTGGYRYEKRTIRLPKFVRAPNERMKEHDATGPLCRDCLLT